MKGHADAVPLQTYALNEQFVYIYFIDAHMKIDKLFIFIC